MNPISEPANSNKRTIRKSRFPHHLFIESYGVKIRFSSNDHAAIDMIKEMLPNLLAGNYRLTSAVDAAHEFYYVWNKSERDSLYRDSEILTVRLPRENLFDQLQSVIRLTVAEFAVDRVFVHAGVVSWKGKALVFPARSYMGKSTLTAELVRRGALYYSDEYAVFDKNGLVSPFPKMLSLREEINNKTQIDYPVEAFGGTVGTGAIPVGMVLLTEYKPNARWKPRHLSSGNGLIEIMRDTIPIRNDPAFTISVLNQVTKNSLIVQSPRGEAAKFTHRILKFFEDECL